MVKSRLAKSWLALLSLKVCAHACSMSLLVLIWSESESEVVCQAVSSRHCS